MIVKMWLARGLPPRRLSSGVCGLLVACALLGPSALPAQEGPAKAEATSQSATVGPEWFTYGLYDGSFEVSMPAMPIAETKGPLLVVSARPLPNEVLFVIRTTEVDAFVTNNVPVPDILRKIQEQTYRNFGATLVIKGSRSVTVGAHSGLQVDFTCANEDGSLTAIFTNSYVYFVGGLRSGPGQKVSEADRKRFESSLKIQEVELEYQLLPDSASRFSEFVAFWDKKVTKGQGSEPARVRVKSALDLMANYTRPPQGDAARELQILKELELAESLAQEGKDATGICVIQTCRGLLKSSWTGDQGYLVQATSNALTLSQSQTDRDFVSEVWLSLVGISALSSRNDYKAEIDGYTKVLQLLERTESSKYRRTANLRVNCWLTIGDLAFFTQQPKLVEQAVQKLEELGIRHSKAIVSRDSYGARLLLIKAKLMSVTAGPLAVLKYLEENFSPDLIATDERSMFLQISCWKKTGQIDKMLEFYQRQYAEYSKPADSRLNAEQRERSRAFIAGQFADPLLLAGRVDEAVKYLGEAMSYALRHDMPGWAADCCSDIGNIRSTQGRIQDARALYEKSLALYPKEHSKRSVLLTRMKMALTEPNSSKKLEKLKAVRAELAAGDLDMELALGQSIALVELQFATSEREYRSTATDLEVLVDKLTKSKLWVISDLAPCRYLLAKAYRGLGMTAQSTEQLEMCLKSAEATAPNSEVAVLYRIQLAVTQFNAAKLTEAVRYIDAAQQGYKSIVEDSIKGGWRSYLSRYLYYSEIVGLRALLEGPHQPASAYSELLGLWPTEALAERFEAQKSGPQTSSSLLTRKSPTTLAQVQQALNRGEALVHFVPHGEVLGAFVLSHDSITYHRLKGSILNDLRKGLGAEPEFLSRLYRELWTPLLTDLGQTKTVYIVATGGLSSIPFDALRAPSGGYLVEEYEIVNLDHAAELLVPSSKVKLDNLTLVGGLNYSSSHQPKPPESTGSLSIDKLLTRSRSAEWVNLPGSEREVKMLAEMTRGKTLQELQADKRSFKAAIQTSSVVHISTHGYGSSESQSLDFSAAGANDPLLNSGLALSEANGSEEGCMTGFEISNMRLKNLKLVVLSTCRSSAGSTADGIGSVSLRRAFSVAGVRQTVASIWPVNDYHTPKLMKLFYEGLGRGESTSTALRNAKLATLRAGGESSDPAYWAGFVLYGK